jgi:ankyrin repeat protein
MDDIFDYIDMCVYIKYHSVEEYNVAFENIKQIVSNFKLHNPTKNFNNEIRGQFAYTPLHYAVLRNDFGLVQLFIHEGADPTIRILQSEYKPKGILPLYLAEDFGKIEITTILKPYTEECLIKYYFYNSIMHYKKKRTPTTLHKMYASITPNIEIIKLIQNRLPIDMFLPNELWIKILEMCQLKDFVN